MKKLILISLLTGLFCLVLIHAAYPGDQDFTIVNKTGMSIDSLFVSPTEEDTWGEDILGIDILMDGESADVSFSHEEDECIWDIMIDNEAGDSYYWRKINLCEHETITLYYKDGQTSATFD